MGGMCLWAMTVFSPHWDLSPPQTHLCPHQPSGQTLPPIVSPGGSSPGFGRGSAGPAVGACVARGPWPGGGGHSHRRACGAGHVCFFLPLKTVVRRPTAATGHAKTQPRDLTLGPPSPLCALPAPPPRSPPWGPTPGCPCQDQLARGARWGSQEPLHREPRAARFPLHSP